MVFNTIRFKTRKSRGGYRRCLPVVFLAFLTLWTPLSLLAGENVDEEQFPGYYIELNDIVINLTEGEERVYLMLNIGISVATEKDIARIKADEDDIRASIRQLIRTTGSNELSKSGGRRVCHNQLRNRVASYLPAGHLKRLFLLNFILG